jgi:GntR family transcriptional regulator, rspAB operon transcriptional repressor
MVLIRNDIYRRLRHAILTCEFQPGQELHEQELAKLYRVSRSPIRDALLRLEDEDLVIVSPRRGYRVKPILDSEVETLLNLRLLMEPACAAAAARADDMALRTLDRFRGFADGDYTEGGYIEYNTSFHHTVAELADNKRLATVVHSLTDQFDRLVWATLRSLRPEAIRQACAEHDAIIDALQAHDPDRTARLCYEHTVGTQRGIATSLLWTEC